ncbi:TIGR03757 family integrating conjugative element protein [Pokkaliibacter plantistimulans]|uniref:TIGR03757 family integrating conjugative element protein n=1 Tax=Pokkaliibacter plantistimulans TaxID=1635171 RepID=UPI000D74BF28|nr:TIGR03757 family integrating conjugative element protein [Pokkaliibacter plantistimulans]
MFPIHLRKTAAWAGGVLAIVSAAVWAAAPSPSATPSIEVFTVHAQPVTVPPALMAQTRVAYLDEPARLEQSFSANLPQSPEQAAVVVQQRLAGPAGQQFQQQLQAAYAGVVRAHELKVLKVPAVVVGGRYVVYGQTDVALAVAQIQQRSGGGQ